MIPPGWEKVKISSDPLAKVQAICRDQKNRMQYIYHPVWSTLTRAMKYYKLKEFVKNSKKIKIPAIDDHPGWALRLMLDTNIRIGCDKYARDNSSYGVTTICKKHATVEPSGAISLKFKGKSGIQWDTRIAKGPVANYIIERLSKIRNSNQIFPVSEITVRKRFHEIFGSEISPKVIRTYNANRILFAILKTKPCSDKKTLANAIKTTAGRLNHSESICRNDYICDELIDLWTKDSKAFCKITKFSKFFTCSK